MNVLLINIVSGGISFKIISESIKLRQFYNKLVENYWIASIIICVATFLTLILSIIKVKSPFLAYPPYFDYYRFLIFAAMSISIGYEYAIIRYFLSGIHPLFEKLSPLFQGNQYQTFSQDLEKKLHKSLTYYLTIIAVVTPFVILLLIKIWTYKSPDEPPLFYMALHTQWSLLFDIINQMSQFLIIYLIGVIVWIIIKLTQIANDLRKCSLKIDVFDTDELGGLKPLKSFVLFIVSSYFIIITLAIISYIPPNIETLPPNIEELTNIFYPINIEELTSIFHHIDIEALISIFHPIVQMYEIIILSLLLLIGIIPFIATQETIRKLINKCVNFELERINKKYREIYEKIIRISSNTTSEKELEKLQVFLNILEKEEIKIKQIKNKVFDIKTIITFTTTTLLPVITTIIKEHLTQWLSQWLT